MTTPTASPPADSRFSFLLVLLTAVSRHSLILLLYIAVVVSALAVVLAAHENRQQNITLERLMQEKDQLDVEWRNLVLEQRALTEHNRIEYFVSKQLGMRRPSAKDEVVVRLK